MQKLPLLAPCLGCGVPPPPVSTGIGRTYGDPGWLGTRLSQEGSCRWTGPAPTWSSAPAPWWLVSKQRLFRTRVFTFTGVGNSRKTCEAANGIMEKVFIYFFEGGL